MPNRELKVIRTPEQLRLEVASRKAKGLTSALVPTMGYLHSGHLNLVKLAKKTAPHTMVSIFVNPTQFNDPTDYERYPIDIERDLALLALEEVDLVFIPSPADIYPENFQSWVEVDALTTKLEGVFRPGHFKGVTTVVNILFNLLQPDLAVFGEKDFQQLRVVEQMVADLKMPTRIVRGPTTRESDGLALSSRNVRLSSAAREIAPQIAAGLALAKQAYSEGQRDASQLCTIAREHIERYPELRIEYLELVDERNLDKLSNVDQPARLVTAVWLENVRLIDNFSL